MTAAGPPRPGRRSLPRLEPLRDIVEEARGVGAVGDAMIDRERQGDHRSDLGPAVAGHDAIADAAHREDRRLGWIHERGEAIDAERSEIRDREHRTGERVRTELARVRARLE